MTAIPPQLNPKWIVRELIADSALPNRAKLRVLFDVATMKHADALEEVGRLVDAAVDALDTAHEWEAAALRLAEKMADVDRTDGVMADEVRRLRRELGDDPTAEDEGW